MKPYVTTSYLEAYNGLNEAQKLVVETIEGPVLVIAGPGTGKTQVLAARIGNILLKTDVRPENILCLTFTESGTIAMRKRLLSFLGPDAYRVGIFTFHAFCNQVILENLDYFGIRELQPLSALEQRQLIEQLIDSFGPDHPLKRWTGDVYYDSDRLLKLFQLMKTENWSYQHIVQQCDAYLADLPHRPEYIYKRKSGQFQAGEIKKDKIEEEKRRMDELKAAAAEFNRYEQMMRDRNRYDYDDMILWVLNAFQKDYLLLSRYQEQYHYVLVDEYQDTNGSQNTLLKLLLSNPVHEGKPNVLVVGDDDQSIFRFQGANVQNIMDFWYEYRQHIHIIVLTDNYRSSQYILDLSRYLIEKNEERLVKKIEGLNKILKACHPRFASSEVRPQVRVYLNQAQETVAIAQEIERLYHEQFPLEEVAVIYRNHVQSEELARLLRIKNIPVNMRRRLNILQSIFIQNILKILEYVDAESRQPFSREDLLFEILHQSWFGIDSHQIAQLAWHIRQKANRQTTFWRIEISKNPLRAPSASLFDATETATKSPLKQLSDNLEYWIKERYNISLQHLIEKILTRGGILRYIMTSPEKVSLMNELRTFYDFVKSETYKNPGLDISGLIQIISQYQKYGLTLESEHLAWAEKGVNFVTAHSSKGLEFERVFMMGCDRQTWDKPFRHSTFPLPDTMRPSYAQGDDSEEGRRLFYVAMTRAKEHLYISYAQQTNEGKELEKSRYVAEIIESKQVQEYSAHLPADQLADYSLLSLQETPMHDPLLPEEELLKKILADFRLSVTALSTYLKCPISFYYNNLLRIPQAKNEVMTFGTVIHAVLRKYFKRMQNDTHQQFPPVETLLQDFQQEMNRHRDGFDNNETFARRLAYGQQILPRYVNHYIGSWNKIVATEMKLSVYFNGIPLIGIIDKIEYNGNEVNVVDYKTGAYSNARKKLQPPLPSDILKDGTYTFEEKYGGDYWRQAVFYKILLDYESKKPRNMVTAEFDFVEPDKRTQQFYKEKIIITPDDIRRVKEQIIFAYNEIINLQFSRGCQEHDCKWCNFVKYNFSELIHTEEPEE